MFAKYFVEKVVICSTRKMLFKTTDFVVVVTIPFPLVRYLLLYLEGAHGNSYGLRLITAGHKTKCKLTFKGGAGQYMFYVFPS